VNQEMPTLLISAKSKQIALLVFPMCMDVCGVVTLATLKNAKNQTPKVLWT
jgi:hypothetical protein